MIVALEFNQVDKALIKSFVYCIVMKYFGSIRIAVVCLGKELIETLYET